MRGHQYRKSGNKKEAELDGIGLDKAAKEFLAIEFKRTQDASRSYVERRRESLAPPSFLVVLAAAPKKKIYIYIENLKKNSYESHRNFLQPQTSKNLLRKWSRFCKNIL
jgi:hypothetical protein